MIRRLFRLVLFAGLVAAVVAVVKALTRDDDALPTPATADGAPWPPLRDEAGTAPVAAPASASQPADAPAAAAGVTATSAAWVEPADDGTCPDGYPVKAKMSSKIFHSPGQLNYDRTTPDRCYVDAAAAEADGLRAAKR